jgi:hypothetical protein
MTDAQLYTMIRAPMLFNAVLVTVFTIAVNRRFEAMRGFWRAELCSSKSSLCEEFHVTQSNTATCFAALRALIERARLEALSRFGDIDARLTRLENERRILR